MKRTNHTDFEILTLLREADEGVPIEVICNSAHVSQRTFYRWRKRLGGLKPEALQRLQTLERENQNLRILVGRLKPKNPDGVWSGWLERDTAPATPGSQHGRPAVEAASGSIPRQGRHCGSGHSSGRFASLRAGRC